MSPRTVGPARVVGETTLTGLAVPLRQSGVLLGRDQAGQPVLAPVFGSRPVSITFVGGWWAAQVLVHRCLGHGATVVVDALDTTMPAQDAAMAGLAHWLTLDRTTAPAPAGARPPAAGPGRVRPMAGDPSVAWPATATQPLLRVHDVGPAGPAGPAAPLQPWHTQLTALARLTAESLQVVTAADLVLVQRLEALEAGLVGSALLLAPDVVARIRVLDNETVLAVRGPVIRYARLTPTALERQAFG